MKNPSGRPEISVIIVTPDSFETIRRTVEHLKRQSVKDKIELVIVTLSTDSLRVDRKELGCFHNYQIVNSPNTLSLGKALAVGARSASAPIIVFTEDHVIPHNLWAEALVQSHQNNWAAVGPVVYNANPEDSIGWADIILGYSSWLYPNDGGEMSHLPGHNSSYKRDILIEYGEDLEKLLEAESVLHWDLILKGYKLYLEPSAKIYHLNFGMLSSFVKVNYHMSRMFAGTRSKSWSNVRRILFILGSPLIPFVRFYSISQNYSGFFNLLKSKPQVFPILALGLITSSTGEMMGYLFGMGNSAQKAFEFHFHRDLHV